MKLKYLASAVAVMMLTSGSAIAKNDLASFHTEMGDCQTCHVTGKMKDIKKSMTDSQTHENAQCQDCHGSYADLVNDKLEFDPHASHLGDINCTSCHTGHAKPELTCNNCHNFEMEMPFADAKEKKKWDGDWNQDKIQKAIDKGPVETVDVIVVGGGSAGFNAAISAKMAGANVVLFEKAPYTGGNSMLAAGGINAVGTPQQKAKGIEDSVDWYAEDAMKGGRYKNDPKLVQILAEESAGAVAWLESLGANMDDLKRSGGARVERTHRPSGGASVGPHIIDTLRVAAKERDIPVRVNSRIEKIVLNDDKSVAGVVVHGRHSGYNMVAADSVVLATGGYGMNKQMVAYYRPTMKDMTSSNNVTATGDGVLLAKEIGASMTDIDWVQAHPTIGKDSRILISETVRGVGAIMVNTDGQRFISELTTRDRASDAILKQKDQYAWLVFDEQLVEKKKMVRGYEHLGMLSKANTIEELAKITGMKYLPKTAADYNKYQASGKDEAFGREDMPINLTKAPFYAVKVAPGIHHTMGGVAVDTDANVLNLQSWKMDGLFAAGEVTGGLHGHNRLGGNAIAETVVFGRKAGENAAKHALEKK
ncbi:Fumarate reductase flavoprotein subunit precursor [Shewanella sp. P1-14-1]|uniref:flavocytochrome c n=1 Tax=Shewanella sp. P1-14-1 TaxID=1723761 RepID=UPI0006D65A71|nr:flavocytochrome c [Shewanella sp. P1-14-1]KPZ71754.1 Fumarate reductase flavoprotein subunit precursor [Shewanella sp. P1-14-1]